MIFKKYWFAVCAIIASSQMIGCLSGDDEEAATEDTSTDTPVVDSSAGFNVKVSSDTTFDYRFGLDSDSDAECVVMNADSTSASDLMCIADAQEFDLYFTGLTFAYNVPPGMCDYFIVSPYFFYTASPGNGPTTVSYEIDADGVYSDFSTSEGTAATGTSYTWDGAGGIVCNYDYTASDGPNCCEGEYTLTVTTYSDATTSDTEVTTEEWGGLHANCLAGPAMKTQTLSSTSGRPISSTYYTSVSGIAGTYAISSPISLSYSTNLFVANFFDPDLHDDGDPDEPNVPLASRATATGAPATNPYFTFTCTDHAFEVKARIRVMVREWNEYSQFTDKGDPDTEGNESFDEEFPIHDLNDWTDIGDAYPASI